MGMFFTIIGRILRGYIFGGFATAATTFQFDSSCDTWTVKTDMPSPGRRDLALTTTASAIDIITCICDGTSLYTVSSLAFA